LMTIRSPPAVWFSGRGAGPGGSGEVLDRFVTPSPRPWNAAGASQQTGATRLGHPDPATGGLGWAVCALPPTPAVAGGPREPDPPGLSYTKMCAGRTWSGRPRPADREVARCGGEGYAAAGRTRRGPPALLTSWARLIPWDRLTPWVRRGRGVGASLADSAPASCAETYSVPATPVQPPEFPAGRGDRA
jgi:hypothetical protein